ncbi:D-2-hydroxyacid dehydrogenase [Paenibacillus luteus]|uniref:D-2-hydroxyacid dehydrogenase n=1 Tax=Paenibacillus luteus TaxID=2545753 RepID=UPI0011430CF3|nr:D-2-hydroxyacid dehydrogenase [Paenibacillus luteus]
MPKEQPTILVYYNEPEKYAELLREHGYLSVRVARTPEEAAVQLAGVEVILCWNFPEILLSMPEASSVKWIQSIGAGVDHLVTKIPEHIMVTRIVDQFGAMMAEYSLGYMLFHNKGMARLLTSQHNRKWEPFRADTLEGKVLGIAGLGSIGSEIANRARAFNMVVHGLSRGTDKADRVDVHFLAGEWKAFVKELDYLVLTLPLTADTRHTIDHELLMAMKPEACLINVGRGGLIVEEELIETLQLRPSFTAVLDVFEKEPLAEDSPLWTLPNVIITPHVSGQSRFADVGRYFVENLALYAEGAALKGTVNHSRGY